MDVPSLQRGRPRHKGREDGLGRSMRNLSPSLHTPTPSGKARAALEPAERLGGQAGAAVAFAAAAERYRRRRRAWAVPHLGPARGTEGEEGRRAGAGRVWVPEREREDGGGVEPRLGEAQQEAEQQQLPSRPHKGSGGGAEPPRKHRRGEHAPASGGARGGGGGGRRGSGCRRISRLAPSLLTSAQVGTCAAQ